MTELGTPRLHLRRADSTNLRARALAVGGAPHGTLVTAAQQLAGRGRQGRTWNAPPDRALLMSLVLREPPRLTALAAGVAVAALTEAVDDSARRAVVKWPNDVQLDGRKVAGILVEGRPQEGWAVLGIGINLALVPGDLPPELRETATTLGLAPTAVEPVLAQLLEELATWLTASPADVLDALRARDALRGRRVGWADGAGIAAGIDDGGRLLVDTGAARVALDAGEVHLAPGA